MIRHKDNRDLMTMERVDVETIRMLRHKIKQLEQQVEFQKIDRRRMVQVIERLEGKVN